LGDHVSLKAEHSDTEPTENDRGAGPSKDDVEMKAVAIKRKDNEKMSLYSKL
jgi:hypothetical protein